MNGKPSSPVLRGLGASDGARLLDKGTSPVSGFYQELVQVHGLKWREINHLGFLGRLRTQRILCKF